MKIYADCCDFYKLFYCSFALIITCMIAGCSSTTPITRTYTEYIPPIRAQQKECLEKISENLKNCQGKVELEGQVCQKEARKTAQQDLERAQIDYQQNLAGLEAQRVQESKNQNLQLLNQQKEYADCQARNKQQELRNNTGGGTGQSISMVYIDTCTNPQPNGNYQTGVGGYAINPPEPQIEDFVQDAQCYASTECVGDYNRQYETCGGKVLTTTRCFANCVGDAK